MYLRAGVVLVVLCLQLAFLTSCAAVNRVLPDLKNPVEELLNDLSPSDQSGNDQPDSASPDTTDPLSSPVESATPKSAPAGQTSVARPVETAVPDAAFDEQVTGLIKETLDQYRDKAVLDPVFTQYHFAESQSDELIAHIYDLYEVFFRENPQYFWLDGSARITYSILQTDQPSFSALTLEMGVGSGFATASAETLQSRQKALLNEVRRIAWDAENYSEPWQKLLYVHDTLVREIVYDTTLNQDCNNAASALLDHKTLCQGYAQSFQLIVEALGFKVTLISGLADNIDHAWNLVWLDNKPYHVDVTHDDPVPDGGSDDPVTHTHFLRSDDMMRQTHVWAAKEYPPVTVDGAQFYRLQGLVAATNDELSSKIADFVKQVDLGDNQADLLELLYTGSDVPSEKTVEDTLVSDLREKSGVRSIVYRSSIEKNVVSIELLPS
jgi:hypothetical protein